MYSELMGSIAIIKQEEGFTDSIESLIGGGPSQLIILGRLVSRVIRVQCTEVVPKR